MIFTGLVRDTGQRRLGVAQCWVTGLGGNRGQPGSSVLLSEAPYLHISRAHRALAN